MRYSNSSREILSISPTFFICESCSFSFMHFIYFRIYCFLDFIKKPASELAINDSFYNIKYINIKYINIKYINININYIII